MKRVLVLHRLDRRLRRTTIEFVNAFAAYAPPDVEVRLHNIRRPLDEGLERHEFDALILTYDLLDLRTSPQWEWAVETVMPFTERAHHVIAFPQDDYIHSATLDTALEYLGVDVIYTPIETGRHLIYPRMTDRAEIRPALTGYVDDDAATRWRRHRRPLATRTIDVGQRVRMLPAWFGRAGQAKGLFAERFRDAARQVGLEVDISTDPADTFVGEDWYRFLASCRATLGQRGGASLCDPDGSIMDAVNSYLADHPGADFEEVEKACFDGLDGLEMKAVSPRLFDAAMLGTAQILIEDEYLGVLEPWVHYIPTDSSITNIDAIADALSDVGRLEQIAGAAEEVLVRSGRFTYRRFVTEVFEAIDGSASVPAVPSHRHLEPDVATELQIRLTAELFSALQRIAQLGALTGTCALLADLSERVTNILWQDPALHDMLDLEMLETVVGPVRISRAIDPLLAPVVDVFVECAVSGASEAVSEWLRLADSGSLHGNQLTEWIDRERLVLDEGLPG